MLASTRTCSLVHTLARACSHRFFNCFCARFAKCLRIESFSAKYNDIIKHTIKLIGIYLQFCISEIELGLFDEKRAIFENLVKYFLKIDLQQKIGEMRSKKEFKEIQVSLCNCDAYLNVLRDRLLKVQLKDTVTAVKDEPGLGKSGSVLVPEKTPSQQRAEKDKHLKKKQDQIRREFLEKQRQFMQKNRNILSEQLNSEQAAKNGSPAKGDAQLIEAVEQEGEGEICSICHDALTGKRYGVYAYFAKDNLIEYCRQNRSLCASSSYGYSFQSCNHFLHIDCNEKILQNNLKQILQNKILFSNFYQVLCGHCKFLANVYVTFIDAQVKSTPLRDLKTGHLPMSAELFEQAIAKAEPRTTIKDNPALASTVQEVFSQILQVLLQDEVIEEEELVLNCIDKLLAYTAYNIALGGLSLYFKKSINIYRNIYLNFREYFWIFGTPNFGKYLERYKLETTALCAKLFAAHIESLEQLTDVEKNFWTVVWRVSVLCKDDEPLCLKILLWMTKKMFSIMVVLIFLTFSSKQSPQSSLEQIAIIMGNKPSTDYTQDLFSQWIQNEEFKYEIINYTLPFIRRVIGIALTIFKSQKKDQNQLDMDLFGSDFNEFDTYAQFFDSIDPALQVLRFAVDENTIQSIQDYHKVKQLRNTSFQNFTIVILPSNYLLFHTYYNLQLCYLCKDYPRAGDPYLCLVCEKIMCSVKCQPYVQPAGQENSKNGTGTDKEPNGSGQFPRRNETEPLLFMKIKGNKGNLNRHAIQSHLGNTAYLHLHTGLIVLTNYPKMISYGMAYQDSYGQLPNPKNHEWENYKLNTKLFSRVQNLIIS